MTNTCSSVKTKPETHGISLQYRILIQLLQLKTSSLDLYNFYPIQSKWDAARGAMLCSNLTNNDLYISLIINVALTNAFVLR